jgi:predicted DNA-binding transcriptional regulator YafY
MRTREDGWVEASVPWSPGERLVSWILSFGPDAEVVEPPELRSELVGRLEAILAS